MSEATYKAKRKDLVDVIKERRKSLRVTQEQLAGLSGVGLRTIKQLETGNGNPTLNTIKRMLDVLGLTLYVGVKEN